VVIANSYYGIIQAGYRRVLDSFSEETVIDTDVPSTPLGDQTSALTPPATEAALTPRDSFADLFTFGEDEPSGSASISSDRKAAREMTDALVPKPVVQEGRKRRLRRVVSAQNPFSSVPLNSPATISKSPDLDTGRGTKRGPEDNGGHGSPPPKRLAS
jgi:hypothetical protein